jgi:hypothetical protein
LQGKKNDSQKIELIGSIALFLDTYRRKDRPDLVHSIVHWLKCQIHILQQFLVRHIYMTKSNLFAQDFLKAQINDVAIFTIKAKESELPPAK